MNKVLGWIKKNKATTAVFSFLTLGIVAVVVILTCVPSYDVTLVKITSGPETITTTINSGAGSDSTKFGYEIEGKSHNGGEKPTPEFSILFSTKTPEPDPDKGKISDWFKIDNENHLIWTEEATTDLVSWDLAILIKANNVQSEKAWFLKFIVSE